MLALLGGCSKSASDIGFADPSGSNQAAHSARMSTQPVAGGAAPVELDKDSFDASKPATPPIAAAKSQPADVADSTVVTASPLMQEQSKQASTKSVMAHSHSSASASFSGGNMAGRARSAPNALPGAASFGRGATYNPNMYVSSSYLGGNGEKERLEKLIQPGAVVDG